MNNHHEVQMIYLIMDYTIKIKIWSLSVPFKNIGEVTDDLLLQMGIITFSINEIIYQYFVVPNICVQLNLKIRAEISKFLLFLFKKLAFLEWKYLADVSNVIFGHIRVLEVDFLLSERIQDWSKWFEMIQNDIFFRKSNLAKFPEMSSIPTWCFSNRSRDSKLWVDDDVITWPKSGSNVACYTTDESSWWRHVIIIRIDRK